jgi:poly-gamma-glutamate synthesis protein (capsule biosynthesis protein)
LGINLCAAGDVSFQGRFSDKPSMDCFSSVAGLFSMSDLTIANLENPLIDEGMPVPDKCTLRGSVKWASVLKDSGINVVSLANNHMMDFGEDGLFSTMKALDDAGVKYVGAGRTADEANAPILLEINGMRLAVFARTSVIVASPSYAEKDKAGVAFLDFEKTRMMIGEYKEKTDVIILCIHWGLEDYSYPTPDQKKQAEAFINDGVDLVLGHHPHVVQGIERINKGLVSYSSGNFLFDEFYWTYTNRDGDIQDTFSTLSAENRKGMILTIDYHGPSRDYHCIPTCIDPSGKVLIDETPSRKTDLKRLSAVLSLPGYAWIWRLYSVRKEIQLRIRPMIAGKLTWSKIKKIRASHFKQLVSTIKRSSKIASEKSTNPYE